MNKRKTGSSYEELAAGYLEENGYRILVRNFRSRTAEIDIIAMEGRYLVFAEVKQRRNARRGSGAESVDVRKQRRICQAAGWFILKYRIPSGTPVRFDVVSIDGDKITLYRNAFEWNY